MKLRTRMAVAWGQTVGEAGKGATIAYRGIQSRGCSGAEPYFCGSALIDWINRTAIDGTEKSPC